MKKINENTKITLTLGQLKRLVKENAFTEDSTNAQPIVDFSKLPDDELERIVREWWKTADEDDRRWAIYYTLTGVSDDCWVEFVANHLNLPGVDPRKYDSKQSDFCKHVCCDIMGGLTKKFFTKPL